MSDGWVVGEEMMDTEDRIEVRMKEGDKMEGGQGRDALSHSVTNDGGRSKPFHS